MKKRILALILSLAMIFSVSAVNLSVIAKTTDPSITLESVEGENGQDVSLRVLIDNNPGIWGMDLKVSYDKSALTLTSVDNGDFYQASEWTKGNLSADVYILSYEASGFDNITTQSGTLATLNFKVRDTAVAGDYAVTASYNPGDIINVEFDDIDFNITNGKVTIKAKPVSATGVTLNKDTLSLGTGASETLIATLSPDTATNKTVKWESSDTSVATVDNNGKVTALKKGNATITVTTEDGEFTATCDVSVNCSHKNTTVHHAVASTCQVQGNDKYTTCNDCGVVISGSDAKLPLADHTYTEKAESQYLKSVATCKAKAVYNKSCSVCGIKGSETFEYGKVNPENHTGSTYLKDQKEATCYEEGYSGDTYCSDCDVKIKDGTVIEKSSHNPASVWSTNETDHWKECTVGCGNLIDKAPHTGGEATCTAQAICSVCKVPYGATAPHSYTIPQKDTSYHWNKCANCEATDTKVSHTFDQKVKNANTLKTAADCDDDAVYYYSCTCGHVSTTLTFVDIGSATGNHTDVNNKWETDGKKHWHTCECGEVIDEENHKGGTATCKNEAVCSVCGVKYGEKNPANHTGGTEIKDMREAKCNAEGYTGNIYCKDCGVKISNGKAIAKTPHVVTEWTVTKEATAESTGIKSGKCNGCGETIIVTTAKLVSEVKKDNINGIDAEIEGIGETNLSEDVIFEVNNVTETITAPEKTKVENSIKSLTEFANHKIGAIFDLSLILRETADNGDTIAETELVLTGTVKVTIPVPTAITENLTDLKLLHIKDDGTVKEVPFTLAGGKATFETDGFSYYTFVGTEKTTSEDTNNQTPSNNETDKSLATGDNSNLLLWIAVMFVSVSALVALSVIDKKKKQSR